MTMPHTFGEPKEFTGSAQAPGLQEFRVFVMAIDDITPEKFRVSLQAKVVLEGGQSSVGREIAFFLNDFMLGVVPCDKWGRANTTLDIAWTFVKTGKTLTAELEGFSTPLRADLELPERPKTQEELKTEDDERQIADLERLMVEIPSASFLMGQNEKEQRSLRKWGWWNDAFKCELPQHQVRLSAFAIGKYPVTQAQWQVMMETNRSHFQGEQRPVENVSWEDAQEFCRRLSQRTGKMYRLLTEAEWEYACRAGTETIWSFSNEPAQIKDYAWFSQNAVSQTRPVGQLKPNAWGLYDMHGNVWEWCQDVYHQDFYGRSRQIVSNPLSSDGGWSRVLRGGSWNCEPVFMRSAYRYSYDHAFRHSSIGFRLARTLDAQASS